ncbi:MAG: AMP-binding protein [Pseudomonadota bacterium]
MSEHNDLTKAPRHTQSWKGAPLQPTDIARTLFGALEHARRFYGGNTKIVQDQTDAPLSYNALVRAAYALGGKIAKTTSPRDVMGVLLPTCVPAVITLFALQATGRTPAVLNYLAGAEGLRAACALSGVRCILTSRRFLETARLTDTIAKLEPSVRIVHLEDLRHSITPVDKLIAGMKSLFPILHREQSKHNDVALILFTSGTTGAPKGVALTHANLLANIAQCRAHIPFNSEWVFFNSLPVFHAFGLVGGALLPILGGMKTVLYPSPLDHERIPKVLAATGANVLVSTDTFARLYARAADPQALKSLRYVVLGGEHAHEKTRALLARKSSALVLQGYGATECGPVVAINQPEANKPETVGKLLPGMEARLEHVSGFSEGGLLFVRGPNVMLGYLDSDRPGQVSPRLDQWFDTGDLASVDQEGFITITGRLKRFAVIGGEMISLEAIEAYAGRIWPDNRHVAISVLLDGDRETIVLVTDQRKAKRLDFASWTQARDIPALFIPDRIVAIRKVPLLPTGKPDYIAVRRVLSRKLGALKLFENIANRAPKIQAKPRSQ